MTDRSVKTDHVTNAASSDAGHMSQGRPVLLYLINSLEVGGAEIGLANLVNRGVFEQFDLKVMTLWPSDAGFLTQFPELTQRLHGSLLDRSSRRGPEELVGAALKLRAVFTAMAPSVVVASLPQSALVARLANWLTGRRRPVVTFEHTVQLRSKFAAPLMRATTRANQGVIADSDTTLKQVRRLHGYRKQTPSYILPLQDISSCLAERAPSFKSDRLRLVFVGRMVESKNLHNLLIGVQKARLAGVPVELSVYGTGPLREELERSAEALGLRGAVEFGGLRFGWTHELAGHDVFGALVSLQEGLSITALQFLALGCPLLTTAAGEIATYTRHGSNAFVTEGPSPHAIADALVNAWAQRDNWQQMSVKARQSAAAFDASAESAHTREGLAPWLRSLMRSTPARSPAR